MKEIFLPLCNALKAAGVPYVPVCGPTSVPLAIGGTRIEFRRDDTIGDLLGPARSQRPNPQVVGIRSIGFLVRVHASSTRANADRADHEALADAIVEQVRAKLHTIVRESKTLWNVTRAGLVANTDVPDGWAGVTYELRFSIDVSDRNVAWLSDGAGEFTFKSDTTKTVTTATGPATPAGLPGASTRTA